MVELKQEHQDRESDLLAQISDMDDRARSYKERLDELASTNSDLREALCNQESGFEARVDAVQRQLTDAIQQQASLNIHIAMLQGELRVTIAAAESREAVVVERDASMALITAQVESALEDETAASIALAQARAALADTVHMFRGLAIQVRPTLGLEEPLIPSVPDGSIDL
jgi:chromosome segregation ATPase